MAMFLQLLLITGMSLLEVIYGRDAAFCNETLTGSSGSLSSPEDDIILSFKNLHCQYDIDVGGGNAVMLGWYKFKVNGKMPLCLENYVEIFIGCERHSIGRYCSDQFGCTGLCSDFFTVYSPDSCLRIIYHTSDSYDGKGGISAYYRGISRSSGKGLDDKKTTYNTRFYSPGECHRNKLVELGSSSVENILSPQWPLFYSPPQDCYWRIYTGKASQKTYRIIFMDFYLQYDARCHNATVIIKGGAESQQYSALSAINGSMCGIRNPFYVTITAERVWLRFKSEKSDAGGRFAVGIVAYEADTTSLSGGAVAGIVVSVIVALIAFVGCLLVYRRRRARRQQQSEQQQRTTAARDAVIRRAAAGRAAAHHSPTSAPPPTGNASPPPQQRNTPPPEPDCGPPSYREVMAKAYPK